MANCLQFCAHRVEAGLMRSVQDSTGAMMGDPIIIMPVPGNDRTTATDEFSDFRDFVVLLFVPSLGLMLAGLGGLLALRARKQTV